MVFLVIMPVLIGVLKPLDPARDRAPDMRRSLTLCLIGSFSIGDRIAQASLFLRFPPAGGPLMLLVIARSVQWDASRLKSVVRWSLY
jgi:hypothetical protein